MCRTKKFIRTSWNVLAVGVLCLAPGTASATSGYWVLSGNTTLTEDHYGTIMPNGFHLECNQHGIFNDVQGPICERGTKTCGINLSNSEYSKIFNCRIEGFEVAVFGEDGKAANIQNSSITGNNLGIHLRNWQGSAHTYIQDNLIAYNDRGIILEHATDQKILNNQIWHNALGIYVSYGDPVVTRIENNDIWHNDTYGLKCWSAPYVHAYHNIMEENGIMTQTDGIFLHECNYFDIWDNRLLSNVGAGLYVSASNDGIIEANTGLYNGLWDAIEFNSTGNSWLSNTWGMTSPDWLP